MRDILPKPQEILERVFTVAKDKPFILTQGQFTLEPVEYAVMMFLGSLDPNSRIDISPVGQKDYMVVMSKDGHLTFYQVVEYNEKSKDQIVFHGLMHKVHVHFVLPQNEINYLKGFMSCLYYKG